MTSDVQNHALRVCFCSGVSAKMLDVRRYATLGGLSSRKVVTWSWLLSPFSFFSLYHCGNAEQILTQVLLLCWSNSTDSSMFVFFFFSYLFSAICCPYHLSSKSAVISSQTPVHNQETVWPVTTQFLKRDFIGVQCRYQLRQSWCSKGRISFPFSEKKTQWNSMKPCGFYCTSVKVSLSFCCSFIVLLKQIENEVLI